MEYRNLGVAGVKVSRLCLGTMMFGGPTDEAESIRIMHKACDLGINFFDTANVYNDGGSERVVGKAIADRRNQIVLATKGRLPSRSPSGPGGPNDQGASRIHLLREVEQSLRRLNTEVIDLYYIHSPDRTTPIEETLRTLENLVQQGKIRYIGLSNYRTWQLCQALRAADRLGTEPIAALQPLYNIVNRDIEVDLLPLCREAGVGAVSYSPLARGVLAAKYKPGEPYPEGSRAARGNKRMEEAEIREESFVIAQKLRALADARGVTVTQFALSWCLANPLLTSAIVGPRTMEQFEDNLGCLKVQISPEDEATVDALVPPGEHSGKGFPDPAFPVEGRPKRKD